MHTMINVTMMILVFTVIIWCTNKVDEVKKKGLSSVIKEMNLFKNDEFKDMAEAYGYLYSIMKMTIALMIIMMWVITVS